MSAVRPVAPVGGHLRQEMHVIKCLLNFDERRKRPVKVKVKPFVCNLKGLCHRTFAVFSSKLQKYNFPLPSLVGNILL